MWKVYSKTDLMQLFQTVGIQKGMTLLVHSSLASMGLVVGGSETFVDCLLESIGEEGILLFPFQLTDRKDITSLHARFSLEDITKFRAEMIPFDATKTDCFGGSVIAENLRRRNASLTAHPIMKFLVYGKDIDKYLQPVDASYPFGENSVLAQLYEQNAYVLSVGVGFREWTCLHLAEARSKVFPVSLEAYLHEEGCWKTYLQVQADYDKKHYTNLETLCAKREWAKTADIPGGSIKLFPMKEVVDLAQAYFIKNKLSF